MSFLFELSGEHEELSRAEIRGCAEAGGFYLTELQSDEGSLLAETDAPPRLFESRCGLLWRVSDIIHSGPVNTITEGITDALKEMELAGTFAVRAKGAADPMALQREAGRMIAEANGLKVNLSSPDTAFRIFVAGETAFFGPVVAEIDRSTLEQRKVQNRPFFSPISIHPKYARVLINLARAPEKGSILDPFCGTGGVLIEAGKMGLRPLGSDISQDMVEGSLKNLNYEGLTAELKRCDISSIKREFGQVDAIATDPPYGRASTTNREGIESLYSRMLTGMRETVRPGGYISLVVPDLSLIEDMPEGLALMETYSLRVHRSLTRNFVVLQRSD